VGDGSASKPWQRSGNQFATRRSSPGVAQHSATPDVGGLARRCGVATNRPVVAIAHGSADDLRRAAHRRARAARGEARCRWRGGGYGTRGLGLALNRHGARGCPWRARQGRDDDGVAALLLAAGWAPLGQALGRGGLRRIG
jgi:hypothetical protein